MQAFVKSKHNVHAELKRLLTSTRIAYSKLAQTIELTNARRRTCPAATQHKTFQTGFTQTSPASLAEVLRNSNRTITTPKRGREVETENSHGQQNMKIRKPSGGVATPTTYDTVVGGSEGRGINPNPFAAPIVVVATSGVGQPENHTEPGLTNPNPDEADESAGSSQK